MSTEEATILVPETAAAPPRLDSFFEFTRKYGIVIGAVLLAVGLAIASPQFLTSANAANLLDQWSPAAIVAAGLTLVFITGMFDLSIGSTFALAGVVAAEVANSGHIELAMVAGVAVGVAVGAINATVVTIGRIDAFVATLSSGFIIGGIALAITNGLLVSVDDLAFGNPGQGTFLGLTWGVYLMVVTVTIVGFVLHRTIFGRHIYAVGGNAEAALLSGVRVNRVVALTLVLMGGLSGLAGTLEASRVSTGDADAGGLTLLFNVFAIVIVGGTSPTGGEGAMWRTAVGVVILAMIGNAFVLLNLTAVYQQVFFGAIILLAVALDARGRAASTR